MTLLWPLLALAAALLAARATAAPPWGRALAAATVALLPYWKIDLGYAEGLLAVLLLAALGEVPRLGSSRFAPFRLALFLTLAAWTKQEGAVAARRSGGSPRSVPAGASRRSRGRLDGASRHPAVAARRGPLRSGARLPVFALSSFSLSSLATAGRTLFHDAILPQAPWLARGSSPARPRPCHAPSPARGPRRRRALRGGARLVVRLHPARPRLARLLVVGPAGVRDRRASGSRSRGGRGRTLRGRAARAYGLRAPRAGACQGWRGIARGSKRRTASSSVSRGVPSAGRCPRIRSAKASVSWTRASSRDSSGSAPSRFPSFFAVRPEDEGEVRVRRRREAERALERDLPGRGREEVRAPDDPGDALLRVVDDDGELVGERAVGPLHDEVADRDGDVFGKRTEEKIIESEETSRGAEAKSAGCLALRQPRAARAGVDQPPAVGRVAFVAGSGCRGCPREIRPRARAGVDDLLSSKKLQAPLRRARFARTERRPPRPTSGRTARATGGSRRPRPARRGPHRDPPSGRAIARRRPGRRATTRRLRRGSRGGAAPSGTGRSGRWRPAASRKSTEGQGCAEAGKGGGARSGSR